MNSGIVYFEEIVENIKDATGYTNMAPLREKTRRFVFNTEQDIGAGGLIVRKKKSYTKGDGNYDGNNIIIPYDFVGESSFGSLSAGVLNGNVITLNCPGPDEIDLYYLGFLLDDNGNPFTTRNHLEACVLYAQMRLYSSKVFTGSGSRQIYKDIKQEYNDAVLEARGNDVFPTEEEWNEIGRTLNGGAFESYNNCLMYSTGKTCNETAPQNNGDGTTFTLADVVPTANPFEVLIDNVIVYAVGKTDLTIFQNGDNFRYYGPNGYYVGKIIDATDIIFPDDLSNENKIELKVDN